MYSFTYLDTVRKPEYTGENRCIPCTMTNVVIALVLSAAVGAVALPVGLAVLAVSLAAIYLRGYLVPGTPEFTKRYFPEWLLARFDKRPEPAFDASSFSTEAFLLEAGVVVDDPEAADLVLAPDFQAAWEDRMSRMGDGDTDREELADLVVVDDEFEVDWFGDAFVATAGDERIGQWESRAAFVADVTAARELAVRHPDWQDFPLAVRSSVLGGLRVFLERCPTCDGRVEIAQEVQRSCCRTYDIVAVECVDCGARLLEADFDPSVVEREDPTEEVAD